MEQKSILVEKVLDGVREHIIESCERYAARGATCYSIHLKQDYALIKDLLLEECIKLSKEFQDNGYKVSIDDSGKGYYVNFIITISWNDKVEICEGILHNNCHLYDTDNGIINEHQITVL